MNARRKVEDDMKSSVSKALRKKILLNPKMGGTFFADQSKISSKYSVFSNEEEYINEYSHRYEEGCYLATFEDGAFIQVNYEFSVKKKKSYLEKMNLCYLPPVNEGVIKKDYLRIDYNNSPDNSFFHAYAHVHIGFRNQIRIPIDEVLLFSEFLKIILFFFYPESFSTLYKQTTNTVNSSVEGKLTRCKVLTNELEKFIYIHTENLL